MSKVFEGRGNISVKVIADSTAQLQGKPMSRMTTMELTYPRIVHSEFMTHRAKSKNAMSSRAVPIKDMIQLVENTPAMPVEWGSNNPGMRSLNLLDEETAAKAKDIWLKAAKSSAGYAQELADLKAHKQIANRLLEAFQMIRVVVSATDWENFFWLRVDEDADPTIHELAKVMKQAYDDSKPEKLSAGEWHTPYVEHVRQGEKDELHYFVRGERDDHEKVYLTAEEAKSVSSSCCAQVSYRRLDASKDKALDIYSKLLSGNKVHASPFEHVATPMPEYLFETPSSGEFFPTYRWPQGVTHVTREGQYYSGNSRGFIQLRQLLEGNVKKG